MLRVSLFLGANDQDLVGGFEARERRLAVGPPVLEVFNRHARRVLASLQVAQQARLVLDARDDGPVGVLAHGPGLLRHIGGGEEVHARMTAQHLGHVLLVALALLHQAQVAQNIIQRLGPVLLAQVRQREVHLRPNLVTEAGILRLRIDSRIVPLALPRRRAGGGRRVIP